jgi:MinD superfamily P-loop ATPase
LAKLEQFEALLSAFQAPALKIQSEYCSRLRHRLSKCSRCLDYCPPKAIEWVNGKIEIDPDKCTSCGICTNVCPNGVFESIKPDDVELYNKIIQSLPAQEEIVFECTNDGVDKQSNAIIVPCLGRISEGIVMIGIAMGAKSVRLSPGECKKCNNYPSCEKVYQKTVNNANQLLVSLGCREKIQVKPSETVITKPAATSRREFFTSLGQITKRGGAIFACSVIDNINEDLKEETPKKKTGTLPVHLPIKHQILLKAIRKLGYGDVYKNKIETEPPLFYQFTVNNECTACKMCAMFCPTGAIIKDETGVIFNISNCCACGLCREICYKEAIQLKNNVQIGKIINKDADRITMVKNAQRAFTQQKKSITEDIIRSCLTSNDRSPRV